MTETDAITRLNAALSGRYRLERELGEGGMATVYLARDLKHERPVALKVLKPELAAVVGAERFLAEIKTTANLQHPHILPLHDSGEASGFLFYVMPYVEGESLRQKLDRDKQLAVDEAVQIAQNVAEALDYAHRRGVIHRDVKPANILLQDGKPVVSDFGIALAVSAGGAGRLTETGLSLGTPHYMSPEQATGDQTVSGATDVYALGCVLYEMLVGDPPYVGSTAQAILGKIVIGEADPIRKHRRAVPTNVEGAVRKALEKVPADRFPSAADFAKALVDPGFRYGDLAAGALAGPPNRRLWNPLSGVLAVFTLAFAGALGWAVSRPAPSQPVARFETPFLSGQEPTAFNNPDFDLAPDGSFLLYRGPLDASETFGPWFLRRWSELASVRLLPGNQSGARARISPDGRRMLMDGYTDVVIVALDGGPLTPFVPGCCGQWGPDEYVYFRSPAREIARVPVGGGETEILRSLGEGETDQIPYGFLPGGRGALVMIDRGGWTIAVLDPATGQTTEVTRGVFPVYSGTGHLLYRTWNRTDLAGTLMAASFDPRTLMLGPQVALIDDVLSFRLSDNGTLVYTTGQTGERQRVEMVWVSRTGTAEVVDSGWGAFDPGVGLGGSHGWRLSPDGARLAVTRLFEDAGDVWIKQLPDGPFQRLTLAAGNQQAPFWSPDGQSVAFADGGRIVAARWDGTGEPELLAESRAGASQGDFNPDGSWIVARGTDITGYQPDGAGDVRSLLASEFTERGPGLSPDGRWLAYSSDESGRGEVYVRPFPDVGSARTQISTNGGENPVWARSGREIFFVDASFRMNAVTLETDPDLRVMRREVLFELGDEYLGRLAGDGGDDFYDVSVDGQHFLMGRVLGAGAGSVEDTRRFILVQNFHEELRERVPN